MKTKHITYGAMITALYGIYFLINLQTADFLASIAYLIINLPLLIYTVMYGGKSGFAVYIATIALAFMMMPLTSWIIIIPNLIVGIFVGEAIRKQKSTFYILTTASLLWAIEMVLTIVGGMFILGYSFEEVMGVEEMLSIIGVNFTVDYIKIIPSFLLGYGLMAGYLTLNLSYIVTQRLKFEVKYNGKIHLFELWLPKTVAFLSLLLIIVSYFISNSYYLGIVFLLQLLMAIQALAFIGYFMVMNRMPIIFYLVIIGLFFSAILIPIIFDIYAFLGIILVLFNFKALIRKLKND